MASRLDDSPEWVIYADPPYLRKGSKYVHDFEAKDHRRLAEALTAKRRARVVVSYYDEPELAELYPTDRWTKVALPMHKGLVNAKGRGPIGQEMAPEVLLINGPSCVEGGLFS